MAGAGGNRASRSLHAQYLRHLLQESCCPRYGCRASAHRCPSEAAGPSRRQVFSTSVSLYPLVHLQPSFFSIALFSILDEDEVKPVVAFAVSCA